MQIYNRTTAEWENVDFDNFTTENTKFTLTGGKSTNLDNYYDVDLWVSFRVYQEV
jgi:hypothetical protein